jgi:hypothetical protein
MIKKKKQVSFKSQGNKNNSPNSSKSFNEKNINNLNDGPIKNHSSTKNNNKQSIIDIHSSLLESSQELSLSNRKQRIERYRQEEAIAINYVVIQEKFLDIKPQDSIIINNIFLYCHSTIFTTG